MKMIRIGEVSIRVCVLSAVLLTLSGAVAVAQGIKDCCHTIEVTSTAFENHQKVPRKHTHYHENVSLQISWANLPTGTEELALVMTDPFAPTPEPFVHWVVYGIPANASELPEDMEDTPRIMEPPDLDGAMNGLNGTGAPGYFGPRPPENNGILHAYEIRVYALGTALDLETGLDQDGLLMAIEDHVIGTGMLMGHYERIVF